MSASSPAAAGGGRPDVVKGIALVVAAVFCFSVLDSLSKTLVQRYPLMMVVWVRYAAHVAIMLVLLLPRMGSRLFETRRPGIQLARGLALGLSSVTFVAGLSAMPLAEASAIAQIGPVLITLLAVRFLGETAPPGTWWALTVSFAGVLLIARPGSQVFTWAAFLPLATAVLAAVYQLLTRKLSNVDNGVATLFLGGLVATVTASLIVPFHWEWPRDVVDGLLLLSMGAVGAGGHMLLVRAFENAPASTLAPFGYFQVASSLVMGILVFDNFPDEWALAGMLMIVATGVVMALVRGRRALEARGE
ncbi:MAG: DMT family transporter [Burkholderiaceae bacterium]